MSALTWGVLHPGAMGASVAAGLSTAGSNVLWCSEGRSSSTRERAEAAALHEVHSLDDLASRCDALASVCPPGVALELAEAVAATGFSGLYLEANAIAPSTSRRVAAVVEAAGASAVDGGIVGPPGWIPGTTRLFVSGDRGPDVEAALDGSAIEVVVVGGGVGTASAVKVAYASWTKAVGAALLAIRAYAEAEGVTAVLLDEWARSQPGTAERSQLTAAAVGPKAWRFGDELRQLGLAMEDVGLPSGVQRAAAEVYDRLAPLKDAPAVELDQVIELLGAACDGVD